MFNFVLSLTTELVKTNNAGSKTSSLHCIMLMLMGSLFCDIINKLESLSFSLCILEGSDKIEQMTILSRS